MKGIKLLIAIVARGKGEDLARLCRQYGLTFSMISPAHGAAGTHFMDYLGLTDPEKDCVLSVARGEFSRQMLSIIQKAFRMEEANTGIAMTIPIAGVSGPKALRYISGVFPQQGRKETDPMLENKNSSSREESGSREYDLIVTIVNRGFSDLAIEASRKAGAAGATVLNARGTGIHEVEKFFAIPIQPEKEIILSLVSHAATKDVMYGIIEAAGLQTEGRGLCFSLPVDEVMGIAHLAAGEGKKAADK